MIYCHIKGPPVHNAPTSHHGANDHGDGYEVVVHIQVPVVPGDHNGPPAHVVQHRGNHKGHQAAIAQQEALVPRHVRTELIQLLLLLGLQVLTCEQKMWGRKN